MEDKYSKLDKIEFHGMVSQERLIQFYDNSKLLVMPSLFESFAIPLIEARNRGLWILSSDGGAAPEIISDFAIFFNPKNKEEFSEKLLLLLLNQVHIPPKHFSQSFTQEDISQMYWQQFYE